MHSFITFDQFYMCYFIYRFKKFKSSLPSEIDTDLCFWEINITLVESLDVIFLYFIHDATYFLEFQVDLEVFLKF